jgi:plasmid stabilization system protein ParE
MENQALFHIIISARAEHNLDLIVNYLLQNWGGKSQKQFSEEIQTYNSFTLQQSVHVSRIFKN